MSLANVGHRETFHVLWFVISSHPCPTVIYDPWGFSLVKNWLEIGAVFLLKLWHFPWCWRSELVTEKTIYFSKLKDILSADCETKLIWLQFFLNETLKCFSAFPVMKYNDYKMLTKWGELTWPVLGRPLTCYHILKVTFCKVSLNIQSYCTKTNT